MADTLKFYNIFQLLEPALRDDISSARVFEGGQTAVFTTSNSGAYWAEVINGRRIILSEIKSLRNEVLLDYEENSRQDAVLAITESRKIISFDSDDTMEIIAELPEPARSISITGGGSALTVLRANGQIYHGSLKLDYIEGDVIKCLMNYKENSIYCLKRDGCLFAYPSVSSPSVVLDLTPRLIRRGIIDFAFGRRHGILLTQAGEILTWGENDRGQLGIGGHRRSEGESRLMRSVTVKDGDKFTAIATHRDSDLSAGMLLDGSVYAWGAGVNFTWTHPVVVSALKTLDEVFGMLDHSRRSYRVIHRRQLIEYRQNLLCEIDDETTDLELVFDMGNRIRAHRFILMTHSPHFRKMFTGNWVEGERSSVRIERFDYKLFRIVLNMFYDSCTTYINPGCFNLTELSSLLEIAHYLDFFPLVTELVWHIRTVLDDENLVEISLLAIDFDIEELIEICAAYFQLNRIASSAKFQNLNPEVFSKIVKKLSRSHLDS